MTAIAIPNPRIATPVPNLRSGLVAEYLFEPTGDILLDRSRYGRHGSIANGVWSATPYGPALTFNGTSTLVTLTDIPCGGTTPIAIEIFLNLTDVASERNFVAQGTEIVLRVTALAYQFILNSFSSSDRVSVTDPAPVTGWQHLAGVYDGTEIILYKDGTRLDGVTPGGTYADVSSNFQIGALVTSNYMQGDIALVRIWVGSVPNANGVAALYQQALQRIQPKPPDYIVARGPLSKHKKIFSFPGWRDVR